MDDKDRIIAALMEQNRVLTEQNLHLQTRVRQLEEKIARLERNSSNSSKPPSSDIVNPRPATRKRGKGKRGGRPGHKKHTRQAFTADQIDKTVIHELSSAEIRRHKLTPLDESESALVQIDLPEKLYTVVDHRVRLYQRLDGGIVKAKLPALTRREGLFTSRMVGLVGYLKGRCHMSYSTVSGFLTDVLELPVSQGYLVKCCNGKLSPALAESHSAALEYVRNSPVVGTDETGHKDSGRRGWTWCHHAGDVVFFLISNCRGSGVLLQNLGVHFANILIADFYSANRTFISLTGAKVQWCWAHLIRDIKFIAELGCTNVHKWARRLLGIARRMINTWRRGKDRRTRYWRKMLEKLKKAFLASVMHPPDHPDCRKIKKRFAGGDRDGYFLFLDVPGVEPTNNATERNIRFVVIDRRITQGTNSAAGMRFYERIWTVVASCTRQGRNTFHFLTEMLKAHYTKSTLPSLLPQNL